MLSEGSFEWPILLVEDNPDDALIAERAMSKGHVKSWLFIVGDGEEALKFFRKEGQYKNLPRPAVALLDLKMPKVNGFGVLEQVKRDDSLRSIPIVVLTSSDRDEDISRAYTLGCNSYVVKSTDFQEFAKIIEEVKHYWLEVSKIQADRYHEG